MRLGCGCFIYVLIVFPLLLLTILLAGISTWVLDRGFYEEAFSNPAFYQSVLEEGSIDWSGTGLSEAFGNVPPFALDAGIRAVITPEQLQGMARDAISDVFDMLEGNNDRFTFTLDFTPIQAALSGDGAEDFANAYVAALPECRANQAALSPGSPLPACLEDGVSETQLASQIAAALPGIAERMPREFTVEADMDMPTIQGTPVSLANLRSLFTSGLLVLAGFSLFLWLIDGLILGRDGRSRFLWLGLILLIPAGLVLLAGLFFNAATLESAVRSSTLQGSSAQNAELALAFLDAIFNAQAPVRTGLMIAGGIPTLVAVVFLIFGLIARPSNRNDGRYVQVPSR